MKRHQLPVLAVSLILFGGLSPGPSPAADVVNLDLAIQQAARYEPGQSKEPFRVIELQVRQAAGNPGLRRELDAALARLLAADTTSEAKRFACTQLAIVGGDQSLNAIAALLPDADTATLACQALANHPSPKANDALRAALASARGSARLQIVTTLGDRRDGSSVKELVKLTRDSDSETAGAAIVALGKIATPAALKELTNLRASAAPGVQNAVTEGLLRVAGQLALTGDRPGAAKIYADLLQPSEPTHIRRAVLAALIRLDRDGGEARVLKVLRGQDAVLMPVSIAAIPALPGKGASARFAAELPRLTPTERVWLIESLAARADAPARKAIASQLTASETAVRVAAIQALGGYGDAAAVPSLTRALTQAKAPSEREAASLALTALRGGEGVDRALLAELKPAAPATRVDLIGILARRANPIAVPALLEQAGSPDATVARAAFNALGSLATPAELPALVDQLAGLRAVDARAEAEGAVARTVVRIPEVSQRSVAVRARLAATSEVAARCSLLRILSSAGDAAALGALNAAKTDANAEVRDAAIRTLALWPDAAVWESLVGVMHQPERETYRVLALRGLVRLAGEENARPSPSLVERYRQLFGAAKNDEDRKLILGALSACNHPDALQLAVAQLANAGVRAEAEQAVKKIAQGVKAQHPQIAQDALQKLQSK